MEKGGERAGFAQNRVGKVDRWGALGRIGAYGDTAFPGPGKAQLKKRCEVEIWPRTSWS